MGLRFRKSIKICNGVRVNFGKTGASLSFGTRGCRYSVHTSGRRTTSVGIPGSGLYYTQSVGTGKRQYNSKAYSQRSMIQQQQKLMEQQQKQDEIHKNRLLVEEYENYLDVIRNVHKECEKTIDWVNIFNKPEPFSYGCIGAYQKKAQDEYNGFKPTFIEKLFSKKREIRKQKLYDAIETARKEDIEAYENWKAMHEFSNKIIDGDIDSFLEAINETNPFEDLVEYGSDFEFGTDNPSSMEIEFKVKSDTVVPAISMSLTKTGKLSKKDMSKTQYYDITQDYVCSCAIRLAREIFAVLPVNIAIVHAVDNIINTTNGHQEDCTILSVIFNKEKFMNINFDRIDASDFVETFLHNMKFMKTSGFRQVVRLNLGEEDE